MYSFRQVLWLLGAGLAIMVMVALARSGGSIHGQGNRGTDRPDELPPIEAQDRLLIMVKPGLVGDPLSPFVFPNTCSGVCVGLSDEERKLLQTLAAKSSTDTIKYTAEDVARLFVLEGIQRESER